jgi:hypothetical protein
MPTEYGGYLRPIVGVIELSLDFYSSESFPDLMGTTHEIEIGFTEDTEANAVWVVTCSGIVDRIFDGVAQIRLYDADEMDLVVENSFYDDDLDDILGLFCDREGVDYLAGTGTDEPILTSYDQGRAVDILDEFAKACCCQLYYDYDENRYALRKLETNTSVDEVDVGIYTEQIETKINQVARVLDSKVNTAYRQQRDGEIINQWACYDGDYEITDHSISGVDYESDYPDDYYFNDSYWTETDFDDSNVLVSQDRGRPAAWFFYYDQDVTETYECPLLWKMVAVQILGTDGPDPDDLRERDTSARYRVYDKNGVHDVYIDQHTNTPRNATLGFYEYEAGQWTTGGPVYFRVEFNVKVIKQSYNASIDCDAGNMLAYPVRLESTQTTVPSRLEEIAENASLPRASIIIPLTPDNLAGIRGKYKIKYKWQGGRGEYYVHCWEYDIDIASRELIIHGPIEVVE